MARKPTHKALVDAIIDSQLDAQHIVDRAGELGPTFAKRMLTLMRALVRARVAGKLTKDAVQRKYREGYLAFSMLGMAEVAQDVADHAGDNSNKVLAMAKALGSDVRTVEAIRQPDVMQRAAEKKGLVSGGE